MLEEGSGGSMGLIVGLSNNSYNPITNTARFASGFVNYKKGCTRLAAAAASDKAYQLFAHGRRFVLSGYSGFFHH
jgi:hypothetical protein